jgi:hypothetical protein
MESQAMRSADNFVHGPASLSRLCSASVPNAQQWAVASKNRIILWAWHSRDIMIGLGPFAGETTK